MAGFAHVGDDALGGGWGGHGIGSWGGEELRCDAVLASVLTEGKEVVC